MFSTPAPRHFPDHPMSRRDFQVWYAGHHDRTAHRGGEYTPKQTAKLLTKVGTAMLASDQCRTMLAHDGVDVPFVKILHGLKDLTTDQFEPYARLLAACSPVALSAWDLIVEVRLGIRALREAGSLTMTQAQSDKVVGRSESDAVAWLVELVVEARLLPAARARMTEWWLAAGAGERLTAKIAETLDGGAPTLPRVVDREPPTVVRSKAEVEAAIAQNYDAMVAAAERRIADPQEACAVVSEIVIDGLAGHRWYDPSVKLDRAYFLKAVKLRCSERRAGGARARGAEERPSTAEFEDESAQFELKRALSAPDPEFERVETRQVLRQTLELLVSTALDQALRRGSSAYVRAALYFADFEQEAPYIRSVGDLAVHAREWAKRYEAETGTPTPRGFFVAVAAVRDQVRSELSV